MLRVVKKEAYAEEEEEAVREVAGVLLGKTTFQEACKEGYAQLMRTVLLCLTKWECIYSAETIADHIWKSQSKGEKGERE